MKKIFIVLLLLLTACSNPEPVIEHIGVDVEDVKDFYEFGAVVEGEFLQGKILPTFEFHTKKSANVYVVADGFIDYIEFQEENKDYSLIVQEVKQRFNPWFINYDHLTELRFKEGDYVKAGEILGKVGNWDETTGRTEIDVVRANVHYCPTSFFKEELRHKLESEVLELTSEDRFLPGCREYSYPEELLD